MGSFLVPSNLPPGCIGKDRLGLNPRTLTSTSCKSAFSLGCRRGECGGHCVSMVAASRKDLEGSEDVVNVSIVALTRNLCLARGARPTRSQPWLPGDSFPRKRRLFLARLRKFLTCGPSAGRVERTMSGPCPHWTGCQAASKASRHSTVVPHRCLEHRLLAES